MKPLITILQTLFAALFLSGCSQAGDIDGAIAKAGKEGRMVMLELGSEGCVPCEQMKPVMARLSESYKGKLEVVFVDVKKDQRAARRFGVYAIPVQVFLDKNGKEFHRHIGFYAYEEITAMLKRAGI